MAVIVIIFTHYEAVARPNQATSDTVVIESHLAQPAPAAPTTTRVYLPLANATTLPELAVTPLHSAPTATAIRLFTTSPEPSPTPIFTWHTVQRGETLISIAAEYALSTETLLATNDLRDPTALEVGHTLLIPPAEGVRIPIILHEIKADDDLLAIAAQYGSSQKDILTANPSLDQTNLPVGEKLVVPIIFNQPQPVANRVNVEEATTYTIKNGDIPLLIAAQFDIPVEILLATNDISDPTRLQVGQQIIIPPHEGISQGFPVILHELRAGNSLLEIALRYGSSLKDILAVNPTLNPSALIPGETVAVPIIFQQPRPTPAPNVATPVPLEVSGPQNDLQAEMLATLNAERAANNLPPYQFNEQLNIVALKHAQDMVVRGYLAHVTPEGETVRDRVEAGGVEGSLRVGENIQVNTRSRGRTVLAAHNWFMNSAPHRQGILHQYYNQVGIAIVNGPPEWFTVVIVFVER